MGPQQPQGENPYMKIVQQAQAARQGGGAPLPQMPQGPMGGAPQGGMPGGALAALLQGGPGGPQPGGPGQSPAGQGPQPGGQPGPSALQGAMGGMPQGPKPATMPGATGDSTKPLLAAIQNLHAYISLIQEPQEINLVRNLISMLTQLISRDQQRAAQEPANQQEMQTGAVSNMSQLPQNSGLKTPTPTIGQQGQ